MGVVGIVGAIASSLSQIRGLVEPAPQRVFLRQIYFTGVESVLLIGFAAVVGGWALISQAYSVLGEDMALTAGVVRVLLLQNVGPLFVALYVLARSGTAIASELASMKQRGEIAALWRMGIDPERYLVMPRVLAAAVSVVALTGIFLSLMVFGGMGLLIFAEELDFSQVLEELFRGADWSFLLLVFSKPLGFGLLIGAAGCAHGLAASAGPQGIPVATRSAFVEGLAGIVAIEVFWRVLGF